MLVVLLWFLSEPLWELGLFEPEIDQAGVYGGGGGGDGDSDRRRKKSKKWNPEKELKKFESLKPKIQISFPKRSENATKFINELEEKILDTGVVKNTHKPYNPKTNKRFQVSERQAARIAYSIAKKEGLHA